MNSDANGTDGHLDKDAVFISPHRFIAGGPRTPGEHTYLPEIEHREEAGTPAVVQSIRAGLVRTQARAVPRG